MISRDTIQSLNLKNYTIKNCTDMYKEVSIKYKNSSELEIALIDAIPDPEFLNKMWWVLNYHSDLMDNSRRLRAMLESKLDHIATQKCEAYS